MDPGLAEHRRGRGACPAAAGSHEIQPPRYECA